MHENCEPSEEARSPEAGGDPETVYSALAGTQMTCDTCGHELRVGDYPFCGPGGHGRGVSAVIQDEIPGGMWVENGFPEPIKVHSHSEHRRLLAERGLEIRAKWAGEHDKHLTRWDTVDLTAAAALVSRGEQARAERRRLAEQFPIEVTNITFEKPEEMR